MRFAEHLSLPFMPSGHNGCEGRPGWALIAVRSGLITLDEAYRAIACWRRLNACRI
jgi:hypothetical protein